MDELDELAPIEAEIRRVATSIVGTFDQRGSQLRDRGVYRRYAEVFSRYLAAFEASPSELEPLKRAAFLAWYAIAEPACFSGLEVPAEATQLVGMLLERHASRLDSEFRWMLALYRFCDPWVFPNLNAHAGLRSVLQSTPPDAWRADSAAKDQMAGRGLMGEYWLSLLVAGGAAPPRDRRP
jgi:hypothetical protein